MLQPADIGLILSYRCLADCAHCLYNCGSAWHDWMGVDEVTTALKQAKTMWGQGFQVHLTGGEPFLNFPLLLESVKAARDLNIPIYAETNAGWCKDISFAESRFEHLKQAGLEAVLVSVSPFHQESIPLQRTLNGISAARLVFGESRVYVYQADWLPEMVRHQMTEQVLLDTYISHYGQDAGKYLWYGFGLISGGRAGYRLGNLISKQHPEDFKGMTCQAELLHAPHSHLDLYGNFIPGFCGGISMGDWHNLKKVVQGFRQGKLPPMLQLLNDGGPYQLFKTTQESFGYKELTEGYAGKCHLCVDVRQHMTKTGVWQENLRPSLFYEVQ